MTTDDLIKMDKMKLHERLEIEDDELNTTVLRVVGGWLYQNSSINDAPRSVFVPIPKSATYA